MNPSIFHLGLIFYLMFLIKAVESITSTSRKVLYLRGRSDSAAKVESCSDHTVTLTVSSKTQSPTTGTLLVVVPSSTLESYEECEFLVRHVIAVNNLRSATDTRSPHISAELQTQPAFIGDVIDLSIFSHLWDFSSSLPASIPLESIMRHEIDKNHPQNSGRVSILHRQDLHNVSFRQVYPRSCSKWFVVSSSGRCVYSGCNMDRNGDPGQCFPCGRNCSNGCSFVPDSVGDIFNFSKACCTHDYCYSSLFSKKTCDDGFLVHMLDSCGLDVGCAAIAYFYYLGVRVLGNFGYNKSQRALHEHLTSSRCK